MAWGYGNATHGTASAGTTNSIALAANPAATYRLIQNDGTASVYLSFGTGAAALNQGIRLAAGGIFEMSRANANLWNGQITCISSVNGQKLLVLEGS